MSVGAVGLLVLYFIVVAGSMGGGPLQFARQLLTLIALFLVPHFVMLMALRYQAVGVLLALAGVGGIAWGSWYLLGALSPENRTSDLKDLAIAFGVAAVVGGCLLMAFGVWTGSLAAKRKRACTSPQLRP